MEQSPLEPNIPRQQISRHVRNLRIHNRRPKSPPLLRVLCAVDKVSYNKPLNISNYLWNTVIFPLTVFRLRGALCALVTGLPPRDAVIPTVVKASNGWPEMREWRPLANSGWGWDGYERRKTSSCYVNRAWNFQFTSHQYCRYIHIYTYLVHYPVICYKWTYKKESMLPKGNIRIGEGGFLIYTIYAFEKNWKELCNCLPKHVSSELNDLTSLTNLMYTLRFKNYRGLLHL
jgi:hypothetical protein